MIPKRPPTVINGRYSLCWLLNYWRVNLISLAHSGGIGREEACKMLVGTQVEPEQAQKLVRVLSEKVGVSYSLKEVYINIRQEGIE